MEFQEILERRQSIRKFQESTLSVQQMMKLAASAQMAPSWKNSQTGRYYFVASEEMKEKLRNSALPEFNAESTVHAAAYIVTTFERGKSGFDKGGSAVNELGDGWGLYDLGLQTENLLLQAAEMELDTLVMGIRNESVIRSLLSIPEEECLTAVIAVGKRAETPERPKRKEYSQIVHIY